MTTGEHGDGAIPATTDHDDGPPPARAEQDPGRAPGVAGWPRWAGYAAAGCAGGYVLAGLYWTAGGAGFPFGPANDPWAWQQSILGTVEQHSAAPVVAALGLPGVLAGVVLATRRTAGVLGMAASAFGWAVAVGLTLVVPDGRPLIAVAHVPVIALGEPFGFPPGVDVRSQLPWPVVHQFLLIGCGVTWAAATLAYRRRIRGACGACGRDGSGSGWTTSAAAARWGRVATWLAVLAPLPYALVRYAWALGIPLGVTGEFLREEARDSPGIWIGGALMATLAVGGAVLTLGLIQRWGETYPRWIPVLRGRPVRPRTAVLPAALAALVITGASVQGVRGVVLDTVPRPPDDGWGTTGPGVFFPLWGLALGAATLAYHLRRRGRCPSCGRR